MPLQNNRFLLLYASQTGQAKAIAEEISEKAAGHNLQADLQCMSTTEKKFFLERERCIVIVTSTTGDGEPPDTARKLFRRLHRKTLPAGYLSELNYTLLGLGDSNYTNFCNCGKAFDRRLQALGAKRFYDAGWADDAVGLEQVVEPWIDGLWSSLTQFLQLPSSFVSDYETTELPLIQVREDTEVKKDSFNVKGGSEVRDLVVNGSVLTSEAILDQQKSVLPETTSNSSDTKKEMASCDTVSKTKESVSNEQTNSDVASVTPQTDISCDADTSGNHSNNNATQEVEVALGPSVRVSVAPLSESQLTIPLLPPAFLKLDFSAESQEAIDTLHSQHTGDNQTNCGCFSCTTDRQANIVSTQTLTAENAVKKALSIQLDISDCRFEYQPGDSFLLVCPNNPDEVQSLMTRLKVWELCQTPYCLAVLVDTKKKNASIPKHVPDQGTLHHMFTWCLDIREPPKKALLRVLVEYTSQEAERRRLQELCSKQGASDYTRYIREPGLSLLDVLNHFPSCQPPLQRIIEHLPPLKPRPYSICTSPLRTPDMIEFVFKVIRIDDTDGRTYVRNGVCTGWLEKIGDRGLDLDGDEITQGMAKLSLTKSPQVQIRPQFNQTFHLPEDLTTPLILIGPGTGVAPFVGFLHHRAALMDQNPNQVHGEVWLFYGCRHADRDYLYKEELSQFHQSGVLDHLWVSFSRDEQEATAPRYVQDNLRKKGADIVKLLVDQEAMVYVCGDAANMARDVNEAFIEILSTHKGISLDEAKKEIMQLRIVERYKEDVWT